MHFNSLFLSQRKPLKFSLQPDHSKVLARSQRNILQKRPSSFRNSLKTQTRASTSTNLLFLNHERFRQVPPAQPLKRSSQKRRTNDSAEPTRRRRPQSRRWSLTFPPSKSRPWTLSALQNIWIQAALLRSRRLLTTRTTIRRLRQVIRRKTNK